MNGRFCLFSPPSCVFDCSFLSFPIKGMNDWLIGWLVHKNQSLWSLSLFSLPCIFVALVETENEKGQIRKFLSVHAPCNAKGVFVEENTTSKMEITMDNGSRNIMMSK